MEEGRSSNTGSPCDGETDYQLTAREGQVGSYEWQLNLIAYNLLALLRHTLPLQWSRHRAGTLRWKLYGIAARSSITRGNGH